MPEKEHPAHRGHRYGGAYARSAALVAGDPEWMTATGGTEESLRAKLDILHRWTFGTEGEFDKDVASALVSETTEMLTDFGNTAGELESLKNILRSAKKILEEDWVRGMVLLRYVGAESDARMHALRRLMGTEALKDLLEETN